MKEELRIIFELWDLEREWTALADPRWTFYGGMTFKRPNYLELGRLVWIQDRQRFLKKELRKRIGLWRYLRYAASPLSFVKSITKK